MITKVLIKENIQHNNIKFIQDPNLESGTVCKIGDYWFYFGGFTAEELNPKDFLANIPLEDIVDEIYETLESFRKCGDFEDEYKYYEQILTH